MAEPLDMVVHNAATDYANLLADAGMGEDDYNNKRDALKGLLEGVVGEQIEFDIGVQGINVEDGGAARVADVKNRVIAMIQRVRAASPEEREEAEGIIDEAFGEVWAEYQEEGDGNQGGGRRKTIRRHRKGRKGTRRQRKGHKKSRKQKGGTRKNLMNMKWLNRRVNRLTRKNLQREENFLSESEHDEMPGRRWLHRR
jgi:hypothetical protein